MSADKAVPKQISSRHIYRGRIISVRTDEIELEGGLRVNRDVVDHPGAVVIVPVNDDGDILWVSQYRYATGRTLLELPAGTLAAGEEPLACAQREVQEETGFSAREWRKLGCFYSAPGFTSEYLHAFAASGLTAAEAHPDEDEDIDVVPLSEAESVLRMEGGEIEDAKSLAAFFLWLRKRA